MDILKVIDLEKSYIDPDTQDHFKAVDGISFEIKANQIYGILGPNGAGKTTTLEMIEGLTDIDGGFAYVKGINVAEKPFKVKEIIGVQLQSNEYFDSLSLKELLILFGKLYKNDVDVADQAFNARTSCWKFRAGSCTERLASCSRLEGKSETR